MLGPIDSSTFVVVHTRGKGIASKSPSSKSKKKKKRKLIKASKRERKRTKLMASVTPEAEIVEICFRFHPVAFAHIFFFL